MNMNAATPDAIEARLVKQRQYAATYKANHLEAYKATMAKVSARHRQRRPEREALAPELREARLALKKTCNAAHKEQRTAYNKAYRARKREERKAQVLASGGGREANLLKVGEGA